MSYKNATPQKQADGTFLLRYQVVDAADNPIGQPSVFTGATEAECYQKAVHAHQTATAAIERLRKRQPTHKPGSVDEAIEQAAESERKMNEASVSFRWMQNHLADSEHPFFRCEANANILKSYLDANGLEWTADNLEIAFDACEDRLTKGNAQAPETPEEIPPTPKTPFDNIRTLNDIKNMSKEDYVRLYNSQRWAGQFRTHVNAILQRGN